MKTPGLLFALALFLAVGCGGNRAAARSAEIRGNRHVDASALRAAAQLELVSFERHHRQADLIDAAYAMERMLRDSGYAHAEVVALPIPSRQHPDRAVFTVHEGPKAHIIAVELPGADAFRRRHLDRLFTGGSGFLGFGQPLFTSDRIDNGTTNVERMYLLAGYAQVEVGPPQVRWNAAQDRARLVVRVREGQRYTVARVEVEMAGEAYGVDADELAHALRLAGEPYHVRLAAEAAARLRSILSDRGHLDAAVDAEATVDEQSASAVLRLRVRPGPVSRLHAIGVEGTRHAHAWFVRNRVPLGPGDVLSQAKLDQGVSDLYRTGLFRTVRRTIEPAGAASPAGERPVDLHLRVEELPPREVDVGLGWGSYEMLRGSLEYRDRDLFGTGRQWTVGTDASLRGHGAHTGVADAYNVGPRNTLSLIASYEFRQEPSFDATTDTIETSFRHDFVVPYSVTVGNQVRYSRASDVTAPIPAAELSGFVSTNGIFVRASRDTRDSKADPRAGSLTGVSVTWVTSQLGADLDYVEYQAAWRHFTSIGARLVWGNYLSYTTRDVLGSTTTLPIQERLFLGGETTVRSFRQDELGPSNAAGEPLGGLTAALASSELRIRMVGHFETALFYDVGSVSPETWRLSRPFGQAVGAGVRYVLPVGPIRVDAAYNPGERFAADRSWAVHAAVGFSF